MSHQLPDLNFAYNALEPVIDAQTMELHHSKHHQAYVNKLNQALADYPDLQALTVEQLLGQIEQVPEEIRQTVINHGGGHANHSLFWQILSPNPQLASAEFDQRLEQLGGKDAVKQQLIQVGMARFGSGWTWLVQDKQGNLQVLSTANQDSPLMTGLKPILGIDVWEHAYYLKYQNRRAEYLENIWQVINWQAVERLAQA